MCFDGVKRLCHIRGKLRKKVWINQGDIILIGLRDYQDAKADVILKYTSDEARNLKTYGEFPETGKCNLHISMSHTENISILLCLIFFVQCVSTIPSPLWRMVSMKISNLVMKLVMMMKMMLTTWVFNIFNNIFKICYCYKTKNYRAIASFCHII